MINLRSDGVYVFWDTYMLSIIKGIVKPALARRVGERKSGSPVVKCP